jgi:hypothetical protein
MTSTSVTNRPRCRTAGRRLRTTSHAAEPTNVTDRMNSYMLPHGIRSAAMPRVANAPRCRSRPTAFSATAIRPAHTLQSGRGGAGNAGVSSWTGTAEAGTGAPAPTSCFAVEEARRRSPNAYSAAYPIIAAR